MANYASETWTLTKADERALGLLERTVLDEGKWRRRYNLNYVNYMMSQI
jgi:hypothetical protein